MACLSADGKPNEIGISMLNSLKKGLSSPEDVAKDSGLALFRVRSGLRNLTGAGYVVQKGDGYGLSNKGTEFLK